MNRSTMLATAVLVAALAAMPSSDRRLTAVNDLRLQDVQAQASAGYPVQLDRARNDRLTRQWRRVLATWYGPGFYGNRTACGQTLTKRLRGIAHRSLPCGAKVALRYRNRRVNVRVVDRGPYSGAAIDLTARTAIDLCVGAPEHPCWRPATRRVWAKRGWS